MPPPPRSIRSWRSNCTRSHVCEIFFWRYANSNAEAMMALACVYHSGLWSLYWKAERQAA